MESRINKPRVFLSHSKADVTFIESVYADLRKCQIEPWLDSEDIRHGKPWLEAIFEDGIPTCDAVLVYFTEVSIESTMVKKEMDAGILQQLKDRRVAFLPYVASQAVRNNLRVDIQALQVPVWNVDNYNILLPKVVAEIWRSFLERMVSYAVQEELVKRLQAELELEKLRKEPSQSIFSPSEEAEFRYLWKAFDRMVHIEIQELIETEIKDKKSAQMVPVKLHRVNVHLGSVIALLIEANRAEYQARHFEQFLIDQAKSVFPLIELAPMQKKSYKILGFPDLTDELMMYGFLDRRYDPPRQGTKIGMFMGGRYTHVYSEKSYRFRYWLAYNNMLPLAVLFGTERETVEAS